VSKFKVLGVRIPNGMARAAQLRTVAGIAAEFGRGELEVTKGQQLQIRWLRCEHGPETFARLQAVGLEPRRPGMDDAPNVIGCPLAGLTTHELFPASPVAREYTARLAGDEASGHRPRKLNVAITAFLDKCLQLESQDMALGPALQPTDNGMMAGFSVRVGRELGSGEFTPSRSLDVFVRPQEAAAVCVAITSLFRDDSPPEKRSRARRTLPGTGRDVERFRAAVEERLGHLLERAGRDAHDTHHFDHLGVAPQRQPMAYSVGLAVPTGRLTASQLLSVADLAERFGRGTIRFTPGQNVILPDVPYSALPGLFSEPLLRQLRPDPAPAGIGPRGLTTTEATAPAQTARLSPVKVAAAGASVA
jgi:ferredoxin-nitrite reductase